MKYLEQIDREDFFFALTGSLHTIEQNIKSCLKKADGSPKKSKMAANFFFLFSLYIAKKGGYK